MDRCRRQKYMLINLFKGLLLFLVPCFLFLISMSPAYAFYSIHVSSCQDANNAIEEVNGLQARGFDAFTRYENVPGKGMWHRVYVGRYASAGAASGVARDLKSRGIVSYTSVQSLGDQVPITSTSPAQRTSQPAPAPRQTYVAPTPAPTTTPGASYPVVAATPTNGTTAPALSGSQPRATGGQYDDLVTSQPKPPATETPPPAAAQSQAAPPLAGGEPGQPEAAPGAAPAPQPEQTYTEPRRVRVREEPPSSFALGAITGYTFWSNLKNFSVTTSSGTTQKLSDDGAFFFGVQPSFRFDDVWSIEGNISRYFASDVDLWYFGLAGRASLPDADRVIPYLKAGVGYGALSTTAISGSFHDGYAWELGLGVEVPFYEYYSFGLEAMYRSMTFTYDGPSGSTASSDNLDLSGFTITGRFDYRF